jgi:hypothetical protein
MNIRRPARDKRRISEADVYSRRPFNIQQRAVQRGNAVLASFIRVGVLNQRGQHERPGHVDLDLPIGVPPQKFQIPDLYRMLPAYGTHDARNQYRMSAAADDVPGIIEIHVVERRRKTV